MYTGRSPVAYRATALASAGLVLLLHCGCEQKPSLAEGIGTEELACKHLELHLELGSTEDNRRLASILTVASRPGHAGLWRRAVAQARWTGCAYFLESGQYQGSFRVPLAGAAASPMETLVTIPLDLAQIRKAYEGNEYFRSCLGKGKIGAFIFLNFDNRVRYDMEELEAHSLHSNMVFIDPKDFTADRRGSEGD